MNTEGHKNWATRLVAGSAQTALAAAVLAAPVVPPTAEAGGHALTIYNQNFAVVRATVPLTLTAGVNHLTFSDITSHLEPDSVVLRDPAGLRTLQVLEQNYRSDPISEGLLLNRYGAKPLTSK